MKAYAFLGGGFDPVHTGHLRSLLELQERLGYQQLFLVPYQLAPTAKTPQARIEQRLAMLDLALAPYDNLAIEPLDADNTTAAYTYDSLLQLRAKYGEECHLSWIIGDDCYAELDKWHRWDELLDLTNIIVTTRQQQEPNQAVVALEQEISAKNRLFTLETAEKAPLEAFLGLSRGAIMKLAIPALDIASSQIRAKIARGADVSLLLSPAVLDYIKQHKLYH